MQQVTMEVVALIFRLWFIVFILLVQLVEHSCFQTSDTVHQIVPSKLQLFEYDPVSFICEGLNDLAGWKVRNKKESIPKCSNDTVTLTLKCTIHTAFEPDSGEYWCEGEGGRKSNTINITVTSGPVILESPVLPVTEGDPVTMSCSTGQNPSTLSTDFYRDGISFMSSDSGQMSIASVRKSDEGFYKCSIADVGMSPESWLAVRGSEVYMDSPSTPVMEGQAVTLRCRTMKTSSDLKADFYKDGTLIRSNSSGEMTIHSVSTSDTGLYNCRISGAGVSPESQLSVKASSKRRPLSHLYFILLWLLVIVILVLQLLVVGLLYWKKQLVTLQLKMCYPDNDMHAAAKHDKKKDAVYAADNLSLCFESNQSTRPQAEKESGVSSFTGNRAFDPSADPTLTDVDSEYYAEVE